MSFRWRRPQAPFAQPQSVLSGAMAGSGVVPATVSDLTVNGNLTVRGQSRLGTPASNDGDVYLRAWRNGSIAMNTNGVETRVAFNVVTLQRPERVHVPAQSLYLDANGAFLAPMDGLYLFNVTVGIIRGSGASAGDNVLLLRSQGPVADTRVAINPIGTPGNNYVHMHLSNVIPLAAGQYAWVNHFHAGATLGQTLVGNNETDTFMAITRVGSYIP